MTCEHCGKKADRLESSSDWGKVCISCFLEVISKEHRAEYKPISAEMYKG
jgi:hypothetical protein